MYRNLTIKINKLLENFPCVVLLGRGKAGILPIEIKYGASVHPRQLKSLEDFVKDNKLDFGLLINQSEKATWLSRFIFQLPVNYL